ncbi:MAG: nitrous oxide reductase family maturation protein NosD [Sphingobacteriaceae bacterium]|nr:nitrous oxide reductase family maturation protein NosD [Sphingobacteriaceae bacterium]
MRSKILIVCFLLSCAALTAKTIIVSKETAIASLKAAVKLAAAGDTIIVKKGTYSSYNTIIDKEVVVLGQGLPVLDAGYREEVVTILASNVKFDGFVVKKSRVGSMRDFAGIRLHKVQNVSVTNNRLLNNFFGIYVSDSKNIYITGNYCRGNSNKLESGNGIHLWKCEDITISKNYVTGHRDGIYFEFVKRSFIKQNLSEKNFRYGLHFMFSDDDVYIKNTFKGNGSGVAVMYSKRIKMIGNAFIENWGSSIYGLLLKDISRSIITNNRFIRNTTGIYMEGCEGIEVTKNSFNNNGWGIRVLANSLNNTFHVNNFSANSFDVTTNGSLSLNHFKNNYWDKYEGYDLDKDGTGDVPYRPVSVYSQIMEQIPQSVMLMRSFIVNLLDKVERAIPSVTPQSVKDETPRMKQWIL